MNTPEHEYHLAYESCDMRLELNASGISEVTWARLAAGIHTELSKPTTIIPLPDGLRHNETEVESMRQRWLKRNRA